mmetsp:Transcript_105095/g.322161  ORF Transcript_105095/g.322161 Transcript_105095/m.322161 type:complete len:220 (-) Transcript_105095:368-1027(-)
MLRIMTVVRLSWPARILSGAMSNLLSSLAWTFSHTGFPVPGPPRWGLAAAASTAVGVAVGDRSCGQYALKLSRLVLLELLVLRPDFVLATLLNASWASFQYAPPSCRALCPARSGAPARGASKAPVGGRRPGGHDTPPVGSYSSSDSCAPSSPLLPAGGPWTGRQPGVAKHACCAHRMSKNSTTKSSFWTIALEISPKTAKLVEAFRMETPEIATARKS